jgi:hypothetical protein
MFKVRGWIHLKWVYIPKTLIKTLINILLGSLRYVDSLKETLVRIIDDFYLGLKRQVEKCLVLNVVKWGNYEQNM